ncbi:MAG: hypothetical protein Q4G14_00730 [Paracoccus sp. (in: a-proteobacteria)]|uniref:hypothetical protein n=1 Tax=Paracoccus sp. TaxID=267 RepID=UPI0026DFCDE4|nr:hypothetical protein [Paracoccus sp. (in: a-proteobacteria)]MDO5611752.1 hypothetical protein [Paracoccus sp. (in: a-proteobacteria)]
MTNTPAPRRLILHVGQTKAGSTSIQNYLETQADTLIGHGFLFPRSVLSRQSRWDQERTPGHLSLLGLTSEGQTTEFDAELAAHPDTAVIFSAENLIADVHDAALQRLHDHFAGWQVDIVAVLRPQFDWLKSRYIENVLSGYRAIVQPFSDFLATEFDRGAVCYDARLAHLGRIMGARSVRAIPFHDPAAPLVRRFLDEIGAPVTDPALADAIHANQREKSLVLIETKRRLNALMRDMTPPERLEVEHHLRQTAKALPPKALAAALPAVAMPQWQVQAMAQGNAALVQAGVLDAPLPLGDAGAEPADDVADLLEPAVQALFTTALRQAAGVAARTGDAARFANTALSLTEAELDALMPWWQTSGVSVHLRDPGLARLFACAAGRWSLLLLADDATLIEQALTHDEMATASSVTVLAQDQPDAALWDQMRPLGPLLLTAPAQAAGEAAFAALIAALSPARILLTRATPAEPAGALPPGYRPRMIGRLILLEHHGCADMSLPVHSDPQKARVP